MYRSSYFLYLIFWMVAAAGCRTYPWHTSTHLPDIGTIDGKWTCLNPGSPYEASSWLSSRQDTLLAVSSQKPVYSNLDPKIDFLQGWNTYHRESFFNSIFLDKKVHSLYRDSMQVMSVHLTKPTGSLAYSCKNCNSYATVQFRKRNYEIPHYLPDTLISVIKNFTLAYEQTENYFILFLTPNDERKPTGCQFLNLTTLRTGQIWLSSPRNLFEREKILKKIMKNLRK